MPTICSFRGISVFIHFDEHMLPHFHAKYADYECSIDITQLEMTSGDMPHKQLKILLGWAALHQEELMENWDLAQRGESPYHIDPIR